MNRALSSDKLTGWMARIFIFIPPVGLISSAAESIMMTKQKS
jgi:hypothetical protein